MAFCLSFLTYVCLSLLIVLVSCYPQAQDIIKITATQVIVEEQQPYGDYTYSARFKVRVEEKNENWICDVGEINDRAKTWVSYLSFLPWSGEVAIYCDFEAPV